GTIYIFLPLAFILAIALSSQGVIQNFNHYQKIETLEKSSFNEETYNKNYVNNEEEKKIITTQTLPMGPAASQIAIKQLGTNGGGFFGVNSAHPLENPTPFSNFLQVLAILLIAAALCYTFGDLVGDTKQGWA